MASGDLVTLNEYLTATGQLAADTDATASAQISWQITAASDAIRSFTDRDFTLFTDAAQVPKTYRYNGYGTIEISDASSVQSVALAASPYYAGRVLDPSEWFASSIENPDGILDSIEIYTFLEGVMSPEMGFRNNLDRIGYVPYPPMLTVTATWGWPVIPPKVKRACIIAVEDAVSADDDDYTAESIAGYSRSKSTSRSTVPVQIQALPGKAIALLDPYIRINL